VNRLDLIIDALESAHHTNDTVVMGLTKLRLDTALAAARELKALKPVGFFKQKSAVWHQYDEDHPAYTALYKLD